MSATLRGPWGFGRVFLLLSLGLVGVSTGAVATKTAIFYGTFESVVKNIPILNAYVNFDMQVSAAGLVAFDGFFSFLLALINITLSLVTERPRLAGPLTIGLQSLILVPLWLAGAILMQKRNVDLDCSMADKLNFSKSDCMAANATPALAWTCVGLSVALLLYSLVFLFLLPKSRGGVKGESGPSGSGRGGSNEFSQPFMMERRGTGETVPQPAPARY
ncbi:unnamed protein product [Tilletia controversa]|uniref:MARVEL domain-containing protein n=3 Tax=Tilletia TaxID=13289 RepID=A0A8X7MLG5_9BASI|nr:hypothetical protein CF328_g7625 [Tilletia controversa]KAE8186046.1 hypothetical protein CF336_g7148 [Tilletia laevis]KAE8250114.1 hypothetical protein A4X03_0g6513 [Tilletia caries]KAE8189739.1 hypothetical protein CF335_g6543 [Tilletia laevis]KAE8239401.1 hypothetical protein A4X06_0g8279 [Tilletia controversa]